MSVGGFPSGASVNDAGAEVRPTQFVAVTVSGVLATAAAFVYLYVRLGPEPAAVKPATVGKEYDATPDSPSEDAAVTVNTPLPLGR